MKPQSPIGSERAAAFLIGVLLASAGACAKVADPLPRIKPLPTVQDLTADSSGGRLLLEFSMPEGEWTILEVFVVCDKPQPNNEDFQVTAAVPRTRLVPSSSGGGRYTFVASAFRASQCHYAVRFRNPSGMQSDFSNRVVTP